MESSVQIYNYKNKTIILQFDIEVVEYDRFMTTFRTDKYIDICSWEKIYSKIRKTIKEILPENDWNYKSEYFDVNDLIIRCEVLDRKEGYLDYVKLNYDLDWIIKITINKSSTVQKKDKVRKSDYNNDEYVQNQKRIKFNNDEEIKLPPTVHLRSHKNDNDDNFVEENENKRGKSNDEEEIKSRCLRDRNKLKQSSLYNFVEVERKSSKKKTSKDYKNTIKPSTCVVPSSSIEPIDLINKEHLNYLKEFVARSEEKELNKEKRKNDLKDYQVWNCFDIENAEITEIVKSLHPSIENLLSKGSPILFINNKPIKAIDITTSNILSTKQLMFLASEVSKNYDSIDDNMLHDVIVPYLILEIFKQQHHLSTKDALERIRLQEEKKNLFNLNDSY